MKPERNTTSWKKLLGVVLFSALIAGCGGGSSTSMAPPSTNGTTPSTNGTTVTDPFALPSTLYLAFTANNTLKIVNTTNPVDVETVDTVNDTTYVYHFNYSHPAVTSVYPKYVFYIDNGTIYRINLLTKTKTQVSAITNASYFSGELDEVNDYPGYIEVVLENGTTTVIPTNMPSTTLPAQFGDFTVEWFIGKYDSDGAPLGAIIDNGTYLKYCPLVANGLDLSNCTDILPYSTYAEAITIGTNPLKVLLNKDDTEIYAFYPYNGTSVLLYNSTADSNSTIDNWNYAYVNDHLYILQSNSTANMIKKIDATTGASTTVFSYDNLNGFISPSSTSFAVSPSETVGVAYPVGALVGGTPRYYNEVKVIYSNTTAVEVESSANYSYNIGGFFGEKLGYQMVNATESYIKIYDTVANAITYNATGEPAGIIKKTAFTVTDNSDIDSAETGYTIIYNGTDLQLFNATTLNIDKTIPLTGTQDNWMEIEGFGNRVLGVTRFTSTNNSTEIILLNIGNGTVSQITDTATIDEWPVY
ncbi:MULTISPECIES: hypothetical protein [unclassified Desulfurobacterium]|uniref:hypothetical protein n=1 Tax=Desulfurobacterium sp. TC5-1 TaxID=1158318 RepID=UPI0003B6A537|nr:hypothetical protein [Desulfurobacterium sp. TC5-1]